MAWFYLILGGVFEVGFTTALRFVDGFKNVPWTIDFRVSETLSMGLLELASRSIPMGTAYAVWAGSARSARYWWAWPSSASRRRPSACC